jgi:hypothetical protein
MQAQANTARHIRNMIPSHSPEIRVKVYTVLTNGGVSSM